MQWNRQEVEKLLNATVSEEITAGEFTYRVSFEDRAMKYVMFLIPTSESVFIAADPERPLQGLPYFEITLPCATLASCVRSGMPTGLGIYASDAPGSLPKFSITRRDDGQISLSGAWGGKLTPTP